MTVNVAEPGDADVLIADDDSLVRQSVRAVLEGEGYTCVEAGDGQTAMRLAFDAKPKWVILDLAMPEMDGLTVAGKLRADPRTEGMSIHCLTGTADPTARALAAQAGFDSFLIKPAAPSQLLQAIRSRVQRPERAFEQSGLSLGEARDLLDRWENAGWHGLEASYTEGGFIVRGVRPAS
jgi:CheY-like chemotaxis protein